MRRMDFKSTNGPCAISLSRCFEFKHQDVPNLTKSMHVAMEDLALHRLWVIYPGEHRYRMSDRMAAVPMKNAGEVLARI